MRSFEERFASLGRAIDRTIERLRERRPARFRRRSGPTLRERLAERIRLTREFFAEGNWRALFYADDRARKRLIVSASILLLALLVAIPWWVVRGLGNRPTLQEMMDQAMVRARLEMAAKSQTDTGMGSWGAGPGAGAHLQSGRKWGPD